MGILMPALARVRQIAFRMVCGSNLSGVGRAMLIYANDYDNEFPRAGFQGTSWADHVPSWAASDRASAFGNPGIATVSSSLYSLVKFAEVTPKSFICKGEPTKKPFKASDHIPNFEDEDAWDFGPYNFGAFQGPYNHCSYSYHMPYNTRFLSTASSEPGMAVAADRNPHLDWDTDTTDFLWNNNDKNNEGIKYSQLGNAGAHQREGQNVLFMDIHVYFEKESFCGVDEDNIYTYWSPIIPDKRQGMPPICEPAAGSLDMTQPQGKTDSLLVNECGPDTGKGPVIGKPPTAPPGCFPADTPVWIDGAQVQISKVIAGQKVGKLDATNAVSCSEKRKRKSHQCCTFTLFSNCL
jgi:hypothetical protein